MNDRLEIAKEFALAARAGGSRLDAVDLCRVAYADADALIAEAARTEKPLPHSTHDAEIEDAAKDEHFQLWADALGPAHVELFGRPLDMGDGETEEETVGETVQHFANSVLTSRERLTSAAVKALAAMRNVFERIELDKPGSARILDSAIADLEAALGNRDVGKDKP